MRFLSKLIIGAIYISGVPLICRSPAKFNLAAMSSSSSKNEPGTHSVAFVTTPNEALAKKLAHLLLNQKLAACINIVPQITSIYDWEGKINEDSEVLMMIKTRTNRVDEICKVIRDNHSYSVAEVISLPIDNGNPPYMEWLSKSVPDKT
ncbi:protein CutA homolog [Phlebotomus papatasi]|uniref:protein CutA homolog n=1 Tax=Phlebotomus papatasi TaxID=29031 RepID=UPI002483E219|nr:protein CutA homolog [Phlebotomus papatasi]XP_055704241.1 protein CutA homolog [Phlebotomus papatasi]